MPALADEILSFWFSARTSDDPTSVLRQAEWWFRGGADTEIIDRFPPVLERAERGELDDWANAARPRLALIIVLDQFSRSIHRGTARAFSNDPKALAIALEGLAIDHYAALETPWEKTFFSLPLGHSEELENLELAVQLAEEIIQEAPAEIRPGLEFSAAQARAHRDVIARFGRHPHRNEVLGRQSTPEELEYLASGNLVHTRPLPR